MDFEVVVPPDPLVPPPVPLDPPLLPPVEPPVDPPLPPPALPPVLLDPLGAGLVLSVLGVSPSTGASFPPQPTANTIAANEKVFA